MDDYTDLINSVYKKASPQGKLCMISEGLCPDVSDAKRAEIYHHALQRKYTQILLSEQWSDGSFGRFHSADSTLKRKYPTTEKASLSAYLLGYRRGDEMVDSFCNYMELLLSNEIPWPDGYEKNQWYRPAVPLFISSRLSLFDSKNRHFLKHKSTWLTLLRSAFVDGEYSASRLDDRARELLGVSISGSYLRLQSLNHILLFSSVASEIATFLSRAYLKFLRKQQEPVAYAKVSLSKNPDTLTGKEQNAYLILMLFLSRMEGFTEEFPGFLPWLIKQKNDEGFWDFGAEINFCQLADSWQHRENRRTDQTILALRIIHNIEDRRNRI